MPSLSAIPMSFLFLQSFPLNPKALLVRLETKETFSIIHCLVGMSKFVATADWFQGAYQHMTASCPGRNDSVIILLTIRSTIKNL